MRTVPFVTGLCAASALALGAHAALAASGATRISVASGGAEAHGPSYTEGVSSNGRFVVFTSDATDLVPDHTNGMTDVFVHDRSTRETRRISVASDGRQGNNRSFAGGITTRGDRAVVWSHATNLVSGDTNAREDVFLHDLRTGATSRISLGLAGEQANGVNRNPSISDDGAWVAWHSSASNLVAGDTNDCTDIFLHEVATGETTRIGQPDGRAQSDGNSLTPIFAPKGRFIGFESSATNLVPGDTNGFIDAFVYDRKDGSLDRVSVSSSGEEPNGQSRNPVVSANGRFAAFSSPASNLVPDDGNDAFDAFVRDRKTGETRRVSVASDGTEGTANSFAAAISGNGRYVVIGSRAEELTADDGNGFADVFVHDVRKGTIVRLNTTADGEQPGGDSFARSMSRNGRYVTVTSDAHNLVAGDGNETEDVFLYRWR